jgi:diol dehydratase reactivase alpha subunit
MAYIAGVDVGNSSTEVAIGELDREGPVRFVADALVKTIGIKGTVRNAIGIMSALDLALLSAGSTRQDLAMVLLNEATPVIGDVAMETITETVITESAMIGHNPSTPGGLGLGLGITIGLKELSAAPADKPYIVIIPREVDFQEAAEDLNRARSNNFDVRGAIVQKDDGVLIHNRLGHPIPIVDEVEHIERIPLQMPAAVEVAAAGMSIDKLSNPYDIATIFCLDPEATARVVPVARALTGARSAVVIKTPHGDVRERRIPAGTMTLIGQNRKETVRVDEGAEAIMAKVARVTPLKEVKAEHGTNVGGMFEKVRKVMAELTDQPVSAIHVQDILAVNTLKPQKVLGGLAGECSMGVAVGLAAMVETRKLPMQRLARALEDQIRIPVAVAGVEAEMAVRGALTTPGTASPMAVLDLGGGSTDASLMDDAGEIRSVHLAGAGDMVTLMIDTELGLENRQLAESVKRHPLAKVESLFHLRHENGSVQFFREPLDPEVFGRVVVVTGRGLVPAQTREPLAKIVAVRRQAKQEVFVQNAIRALQAVAPAGNIRLVDFLVMVGGSALDFEIPRMISDALMKYGVVTGRANVRGVAGPRNAVATGLVLSHASTRKYQSIGASCELG